MSTPFRGLVLMVVSFAAIACSPGAVASLLSAATGPLVTVTTRGGECVDGPCGSTIVIERDGTVHQVAPAEAALGSLPPDVLAALDSAVRATDFELIRSRPFTGECPVNVDGQEVVYEFGAPAGMEHIASCETEVDPDHPVFAAVTAALASIGAPEVPLPPA